MKKYLMNFRSVFMGLKWFAKFTPGYLVFTCAFSVYSSVEMFLEYTYCKKFLINIVVDGKETYKAFYYIIFLSLMILLKLFLGSLKSEYIMPMAKEKLYERLQEILIGKAISLDIEKYDNADSYNDFVWGVQDANVRMDNLLNDCSALLGEITTIVLSGIFFLVNDRFGFLFVLLSVGITIFCNERKNKRMFELEKEIKPIQRKLNYYNRVFYLSDFAKEMRLYNTHEIMIKDYSDTVSSIVPVVKKHGKDLVILSSIGDILANTICINVLYLGFLIYNVLIVGGISIGSVIALFDAASNLKNSLISFGNELSKFQMHGYYFDKIKKFLNVESKIVSGERKIEQKFKCLNLKNISFSYDGKNKVLDKINMKIEKGHKIAIVGLNGSGKSTLIKLILRLYDPDEGNIEFNRKNIKEYDLQNYREKFGVVFQDFNVYASSIADNVCLDVAREERYADIEQSLDKSGLLSRTSYMEKGIQTHLTNEFEELGINLSGGENQKLAISRSIVHDQEIVIMDEASSALDPISEYKINEILVNSASTKTIILISHRLAATVMADYIYVMKEGRIVEKGTHNELLKINGIYKEMFITQSEWYKR